MTRIPRRTLLLSGSTVLAAARLKAALADDRQGGTMAPAAAAGSVDPSFPSQPPELVREMVAVSHGNLARVKELVEQHPTLARAAWDWGFGDWEDALGAASHVGNRPIAELLLANGARPTIFSATMLGQLDVVKAFIAASPGVQRTHGPHNITLLAHARFGGQQAAAVRSYLESLGDADPLPKLAPITEAEIAALLGTYSFGSGANDRITIDIDKGQLGFARQNGTRRLLFHLGDRQFFPTGAEAVRIRFGMENNRAVMLSIHDPDVVLTAQRM